MSGGEGGRGEAFLYQTTTETPKELSCQLEGVLLPLSTNKLLHSTHSNSLRTIGDI